MFRLHDWKPPRTSVSQRIIIKYFSIFVIGSSSAAYQHKCISNFYIIWMFCKYLKQYQMLARQNYICSDILCILIDKLHVTWQFYNLSIFPFLFKIKFHFFCYHFFSNGLALCAVDKQIPVISYVMFRLGLKPIHFKCKRRKVGSAKISVFDLHCNAEFHVYGFYCFKRFILWNDCKPPRVTWVRWAA